MTFTLPPRAFEASPGTCDVCGKRRRTLYQVGYGLDGQYVEAWCFFCVKDAYRHRWFDAEPEDRDPTEGLPPDLARVLRDQSIVVSQDGAIFELIHKWQNAPSNTASADLPRR